MRIHLWIVLFAALCAGCAESQASRQAYVPPATDQVGPSSVDTVPGQIHNPECQCDICNCDPCECAAPSPDPSRQLSRRPGYRLSLLTAQWCPKCPRAKAAVREADVPVEIVDVDAQPDRAAQLWSGYEHVMALPAWVLSRDGVPVKYWSGPSNAAGVEIMATYEPESVASAGRYTLRRGDPNDRSIPDNGECLPMPGDKTTIVEYLDRPGVIDGRRRPTQMQYHPPHQYQYRRPAGRFIGGGGCANGMCGL